MTVGSVPDIAWSALDLSPCYNQAIASICALKPCMDLMTFKLGYGLMHFTNFNNFSAQTCYTPCLSRMKKNPFFCAVSPFLVQSVKRVGLQLSCTSNNPNETPRVLLK